MSINFGQLYETPDMDKLDNQPLFQATINLFSSISKNLHAKMVLPPLPIVSIHSQVKVSNILVSPFLLEEIILKEKRVCPAQEVKT